MFHEDSTHDDSNLDSTRKLKLVIPDIFITFLETNHFFFRNLLFCSTIVEWNKLDINIRNSKSGSVFQKTLPKCVRPTRNCPFDCNNPKAVTYNKRQSLSHLRGDLFQHRFLDKLNPFYNCRSEVETSTLYLLQYPVCQNESRTLLPKVKNIAFAFQRKPILFLQKSLLTAILLLIMSHIRYK